MHRRMPFFIVVVMVWALSLLQVRQWTLKQNHVVQSATYSHEAALLRALANQQADVDREQAILLAIEAAERQSVSVDWQLFSLLTEAYTATLLISPTLQPDAVAISPHFIATSFGTNLHVYPMQHGQEHTISLISNVVAMQWNTQGRTLLVRDQDNTLSLWDAPTGIHHFAAVREGIEAMAWSPDGQYILTTNQVSIMVWRVNGDLVAEIPSSGSSLVYWSPNSLAFCAFQQAQRIRCWDRGQLKQPTLDITANLLAVAWSPDSQQVALVDNRDGLTIRNRYGSLVEQIQLDTKNAMVSVVAWQDQHMYFGLSDGQLLTWNRSNHLLARHTLLKRSITSLQFNATGKRLIVTADTGAIQLWDIQHEQTIRLVFAPPLRAALWRDTGNAFLGITSQGQTWHFAASSVRQHIPVFHQPHDVQWNPQNNTLLVHNQAGITLLDQHLQPLMQIPDVMRATWISDTAILGFTSAGLKRWSLPLTNTFQPKPELITPVSTIDLAWSRDGTVIVDANQVQTRLITPDGQLLLERVDADFSQSITSVSPDGNYISTYRFMRMPTPIWNQHGAVVARLNGVISEMTWSPDSRKLITNVADTIVVLPLDHADQPIIVDRHQQPSRFFWSHDSQRVAISDGIGRLVILNADYSFTPLIADPNIAIFQVAWHPSGQWLVAVSMDAVLVFAVDGTLVATVPMQSATYDTHGVWNFDGQFLAFADGYTSEIWHLGQIELLNYAKCSVTRTLTAQEQQHFGLDTLHFDAGALAQRQCR